LKQGLTVYMRLAWIAQAAFKLAILPCSARITGVCCHTHFCCCFLGPFIQSLVYVAVVTL
jgi:hypothetical protein